MEIDDWYWSKLYKGLDRLIRQFSFPEDTNFDQFNKAVDRARSVETKSVLLFTRVSRHVPEAKAVLVQKQQEYRLELKVLLSDKTFFDGMSQKERQMYAEASLSDEQVAIDKAQDRLMRLTVYRDCVDKVLLNCRHSREDLSKRIKLLEIEKGIA